MAGLGWTTDPVLLVLFLLAVYRLTRLVVADVILSRPREALFARAAATAPDYSDPHAGLPLTGGPPHRLSGWLADLIGCPWCVSMWLAAGWAGLACLLPVRVSALLAFVLAASALAGLLSSRE